MRPTLPLSLGTLAITMFFGCSSGGTSDGLLTLGNAGSAGVGGQEGEEGGQAGSGGSGQSGKAGASQAGKAGSSTGAGTGGAPAGGAGGSTTAGAAGGPKAGSGGSVEPFGGGGTSAAGAGGGAKAGAGGSVGAGAGGSSAGCDPVTNAGCDKAGGQACDFADTGYTCYDPPNDVALCGSCSADGPFCKATTTCFDGQCTPFCKTDGDCKGKGVCDTELTGDGVGVCVKTKGQGDSAVSGCGGGAGGAGGSSAGCDPVTNAGCDTAAGQACDFAQDGFTCYDPPNDVALCGTCNATDGPFCQATTTCLDGKCTPFCKTDGDCKGKGVCETDSSGVGVCVQTKGQGDNAVSGCGSSAGCDPVTNAGCDTAAGQACDFADPGYACYDPPNDVALCGSCKADGPFCKATTTCFDGQCTPFCKTDGDCKGKGVCDTELTGDGVGVCVKTKGQGQSAVSGCGG